MKGIRLWKSFVFHFMKLPLGFFFLPIFLLVSACGTLEVQIERTTTPNTGNSTYSSAGQDQPTQPVDQTSGLSYLDATATPRGDRGKVDTYGTIYFWLSHSTFDPNDPSSQIDVGRIARLPGLCVFSDAACPALEDVPIPFQIHSSSWQPMAWSPDGSVAILPVAMSDNIASMAVYVYRPQDEAWTEIADFPIVDGISWSQDGEWLSLRVQDGNGNVDMYAMRPDGSGRRNLTGDNLSDKGEASFLAMSGWLNGKALIATRGAFDELTTFHLVDPDTGETESLFAFPTYPGGVYPAPDGTLLAVETPSTQKQSLEIIQLDGQVVDTLASFSQGGIYILSWSHDGEKIAFTVQSDPYTVDDQRVYIINRDGTGLTELYRGIVVPSLTFSRDDRYLLFTDQERSLISISLESLAVQKILVPETSSGEYVLYPSWRP